MKKFHLTKSILTGILTILIGLSVMSLLLLQIYNQAAVKDQYSNSVNKLDVAVSRLSDYQLEAKENAQIYDTFHTGSASILSYYLDQNPAENDLSWMNTQCHVDEYYLLDAEGNLTDHTGNAWKEHSQELLGLRNSTDPVTIEDVRYYGSALQNGGILIIGSKYTSEKESLLTLQSPSYSLSTIVAGLTGYIEEVSLTDDTILYTKNATEIGKKASDYGMDTAKYADGYSGKVNLNGTSVYIVTKQMGDNLLIAVVPWNEIQSNYTDIQCTNLLIVALTLSFLLIYAELIRKEMAQQKSQPEDYLQLSKNLYLNKKILSRMKNIVIMGIVAVLLMTYYVHTLSPLSHQGIKNELKVTAVSDLLNKNEDHIAELTKQYTNQYIERAQTISYLIYKDPEMASVESMKQLAEKGGLESVYLFDEIGHCEVSSKGHLNFTLSYDNAEPSYEFWSVVNGYKDVVAQIGDADDSGAYEQYIGVSRNDSLGMVEIKISSETLGKRLETTKLSYLLSHIAVVNNGFLFAVNTDTKEFDYIPESKLIGHSATDFGMKESAFTDGYEGFQSISDTKYLMDGVLHGNDYIYCAVPLSAIYSSRLSTTLWTTFISGLMILAITLMLVIRRKEITEEVKTDPQDTVVNDDAAFFHHNTTDGRKRLIQSATSRYETHISWDDRTSEQKLYTIAGWVFLILALLLVINVLYVHTDSSHSVLGYVLNQKWEKGINLFSLTFVVLTMMEIVVVTWVIRKSLLFVLKKFGARSETLGHLLDSFLKYAAVISGIFYCLNAIGLDSTSLLASASILGLMLSFGAQKLIEDVLAGISIVFEGEFRVGDIITIDNWRGTVVEIGIRTTKVMSGGHDIKIFNNSEIKQVVNMTKLYSSAIVEVGIDYNESLERVEAVLKKELPRIKEHIPGIMEGPFYEGVTSLGENAVIIRIFAQCHEIDRTQVVRDLNRELKLCIDRNHILIPAMQNEEGEVIPTTVASAEEKKTASMFIHEQKEASKEFSETHDE